MKLVDNWKRAWKWYSVHILMIMVALPEVWLQLPEEWRQSLPPHILAYATSVLGVSAILARVISQEKPDGTDDKPTK